MVEPSKSVPGARAGSEARYMTAQQRIEQLRPQLDAMNMEIQSRVGSILAPQAQAVSPQAMQQMLQATPASVAPNVAPMNLGPEEAGQAFLISSKAEYDALPSGATYTDAATGIQARKP
jgi:hypothetical protein